MWQAAAPLFVKCLRSRVIHCQVFSGRSRNIASSVEEMETISINAVNDDGFLPVDQALLLFLSYDFV